MKQVVKAVAALIINNNCVFAAKRAYGFLKGKWELPGGKIEEGESGEQAIKREIKEELSTDVVVEEYFTKIIYEYPEFILDMDVYHCSVKNGRLMLHENIHLEESFIPIDFLNEFDWCPADKEIIKMFQKCIINVIKVET